MIAHWFIKLFALPIMLYKLTKAIDEAMEFQIELHRRKCIRDSLAKHGIKRKNQ